MSKRKVSRPKTENPNNNLFYNALRYLCIDLNKTTLFNF